MTQNRVRKEYFEWLCDLACRNRYSNYISFQKLLVYLHETDFRYSIPRDENRACDGVDLRYRFALEYDYCDDAEYYLEGPCSVLEMMIALSVRCEETIMDDPSFGDRTKQWFWEMVTNLGLGAMHDGNFDELYVAEVIDRFLDRDYEPDGVGGLFKIRDCEYDLRTIEIWRQLCYYLDAIAY